MFLFTQSTSPSQVDLWRDLGEEGRRVVGLKGTGPWNAWVEGVGQGLGGRFGVKNT